MSRKCILSNNSMKFKVITIQDKRTTASFAIPSQQNLSGLQLNVVTKQSL